MVSNPLRPPRGFTLIELVTTMVLIGILAAVAIGRMDFTSAFTQKAAHDRVLAGLQFAAKVAVAERRYVCVSVASNVITLALDNRTPETLAGGTPCSVGNTVSLALPAPDKTCTVSAPNTICASTLSSGTAAFEFDPQGRALVNGSTTTTTSVTVTTPLNTITVVGDTGYVS